MSKNKRMINAVAKHVKLRGYPSHKGRASKAALQTILGDENDNYNQLVLKYYNTFIKRTSSCGLPLEIIKDQKKFYKSKAWKNVRELVFSVFGRICMCCGSTVNLHIDHVKPRCYHPELALKIINLQPLCKECNFLKGTLTIDYRDETLHTKRKKWIEIKRERKHNEQR